MVRLTCSGRPSRREERRTRPSDSAGRAPINVTRSSDLSEAEVRWLNQPAMHLIAEFSVMEAEDEEAIAA